MYICAKQQYIGGPAPPSLPHFPGCWGGEGAACAQPLRPHWRAARPMRLLGGGAAGRGGGRSRSWGREEHRRGAGSLIFAYIHTRRTGCSVDIRQRLLRLLHKYLIAAGQIFNTNPNNGGGRRTGPRASGCGATGGQGPGAGGHGGPP